MHITASVFINDNESGLRHDYEVWLRRWHRASGMALRRHEAVWLEKLAPHEPTGQYQHNRTGEDNTDAHMKRHVTPALALRASAGREVVAAVTGGQLDFGPWERIFYGEFDGRRRKRVLIKIIGE